jgi:hypothetical protein
VILVYCLDWSFNSFPNLDDMYVWYFSDLRGRLANAGYHTTSRFPIDTEDLSLDWFADWESDGECSAQLGYSGITTVCKVV